MSIQLKLSGGLYDGWTAIEVNRSMESLCGFFNLTLTDRAGGNSAKSVILKPGESCQVLINGQQVMDGYIDRVKLNFDAEQNEINVSGRDKAGDLVDCAVVGGSGEWKGLKLEAIVTEICKPFGINVINTIDTGAAIPQFNIEQGMTAFEAIQKLCSMRACLAISDSRGAVVITRAGSARADTQILEGVNIKSAEADYDMSERFSQYIVKGQQQGGDNTGVINTTAAKSVVRDENVPRYRPIVIISDGQVDSDKALIRAKWEASVKKGKSRTFTITINGWKQKGGKLWDINQLVRLKSEKLGVDDTLVIAGLIYRLDDEGEITEIALTDASAYELLQEDVVKKPKDSPTSKYNKYIAS